MPLLFTLRSMPGDLAANVSTRARPRSAGLRATDGSPGSGRISVRGLALTCLNFSRNSARKNMYAERGRVGAPFGFLARCFLSAGPAVLLQAR